MARPDHCYGAAVTEIDTDDSGVYVIAFDNDLSVRTHDLPDTETISTGVVTSLVGTSLMSSEITTDGEVMHFGFPGSAEPTYTFDAIAIAEPEEPLPVPPEDPSADRVADGPETP